MMIRLRSTRPASRSMCTTGERRLRRHAEVVQPTQLVGAELRLGLRDRAAQRLGAALAGCPADPLGELVPALRVGSLPAVLRDRLAGELDEGVAVVVVERGADHLHLVEQSRLEQVQQPGQELALGEVTGRTEQDDGRGCRHGSSLPVRATPDQTPAGRRGNRCVSAALQPREYGEHAGAATLATGPEPSIEISATGNKPVGLRWHDVNEVELIGLNLFDRVTDTDHDALRSAQDHTRRPTWR